MLDQALIDRYLPEVSMLPAEAVTHAEATESILQSLALIPYEFARRVCGLFGPDRAGIAQVARSGRTMCVELARRIAFDRAGRLGSPVPTELLEMLDQLDAALKQLAATTWPTLAQNASDNPAWALFKDAEGTSFGRVLGARAHLMLTRYARRLLANDTRGLTASLRSQISPLRMILPFNFDAWPDLNELARNRLKARELKLALYHFLQNQPNSKDPSRRLGAATIKNYYNEVVEVLDLPGDRRGGPWQRLDVVTSSAVYRTLDDDPPEDEDIFNLAAYMAEATRECELLDEPADPDEDEVLLGGMSMAQRMARRDYARLTAVLRLHITGYDSRSIPTRLLAMGYAALIGPYKIDELPYERLANLTLYHLCLTTGRDVGELFDIQLGDKPNGQCAHPTFDPVGRVLYCTPKLYPELPKALCVAPDSEQAPEAHKAWQRAMQHHHRLYQDVTRVCEVVLDAPARWMLCRLAEQRQHGHGNPRCLFVDERSGKPLTRESARERARERVTGKVTEAIRQIMPEASAVTFAGLRHTFWTQMVGEQKVHPLLAQMQAGRTRAELYSHSFYACVSQQTLRAAFAEPHQKWLGCIADAYADGLANWAKRWGQVAQPLTLPTLEAIPLKRADDYGSTYCVRPAVLRKIVHASLRSLVEIPTLHTADAARQRAWHDGLTYLCTLLSGICLGGRVGEAAEVLATAVDLDYTPPLITLIGKGNRFNEESRTLMIPTRLVALWRSVVQRQGDFALAVYGARTDRRPLRREDVWRHVIAMSAAAGLTGDMGDGAIRFHALRHHLVSWYIARGVSFAHDAYWIGHQTAGGELLHPASSGTLKAMWAEIGPHLNALLDELGLTEAMVGAVVSRDAEALAQQLQQMTELEKGEDNDDGIDSSTNATATGGDIDDTTDREHTIDEAPATFAD